jgi:secreted trypsin-like serine protease
MSLIFRQTKENDIALIKLKNRIRYNNGDERVTGIYPALPAKHLCDIQGGHLGHCVVTGFGRLSEGGKSSPKLKASTILFVPSKKCQKKIPQKRIQKAMLCAGAEGRDACQGDSGGPLVCKLANDPDGKFHLIGVTSWGIGCATPHTPGVYSEVACYMDWIRNVTSHA